MDTSHDNLQHFRDDSAHEAAIIVQKRVITEVGPVRTRRQRRHLLCNQVRFS